MNQISVILTTVANHDDANEMSAMLVANNFAACVQEVDVNSQFNWNGKVQSDKEVLLLIKTSAARVEHVIEAIQKQHKYDLPEIIVLPVVGGLQGYIDWVQQESQKEPVV